MLSKQHLRRAVSSMDGENIITMKNGLKHLMIAE